MTWLDNLFPHRTLLQADRRLLHLFVGRILSSTGFSITIPFLSLYLHDTRGVPMTAVGGMFFLSALAGAAAQLFGGEWADRYGRKSILVIAQAGRGGVFALMGLAALLDAAFGVFVALACVSAFFGRLFEPPAGAMISDIAQGERRVEAFGIMRIGGNLGFAVGPAIGGFLAALSYATLFLFSAGVLLVSALLLAANVRESMPAERRRGHEAGIGDDLPPATVRRPRWGRLNAGLDLHAIAATLRDSRFLRHSLACLLFFTVMGQLMATFSVFAVDWAGLSKVQLGWVYSLNGAMVTFLQFPVVRLLAPYRMTTALALGSVILSGGYVMMGFVGGMGPLALAMAIVTVGEIIATPAAMNLSASFATEETRGRYMGVHGLFSSFGWSLGPLLGGVLLDAAHREAWVLWSAIGVLGALAALGFLDLRRRLTPAMDRGEEGPPSRSAPSSVPGETR